DVDPWEIGKNYPAKVAIAGDPKATLPDLAEALRQRLTPAARAGAAARGEELGAGLAAKRRAPRGQGPAEAGRHPRSPPALRAAGPPRPGGRTPPGPSAGG